MKHLVKSLIRQFNIKDEHNKWIIEYLNDNDIIYIGWIRGSKSDIEYLKGLGIKGPMKWTPDSRYKEFGGGYIERCIVTEEIAMKLKDFPGFMDGSTFTGIDSFGRQVSWGGKGLLD